MMNKKIRTVVCSLALCTLICGCREDPDEFVLVGENGSGASFAGEGNTVGERKADENPAQGAENGLEADSSAEQEISQIYVYVCGAVNCPGVVRLQEGSRADAALEAAGGFRGDAKTDYVNLAAKVEDGQKIYVPTEEEAKADSEESLKDGLININTADVTLLCTLPGIGEARAQEILRYREENGLFETCEDIMNVPGIKNSVYSKIKNMIKIN